jgi:hypothetical protein
VRIRPGQKGTKQLLAQYGDLLICVRYQYDAQRKKRFKTVELLVSERDWEPPRPRFGHDQIVGLRYDRVVALGLHSRIVDEPASNSRCPGSSERISMQMPGRHPGKDARIHCWIPASRGR